MIIDINKMNSSTSTSSSNSKLNLVSCHILELDSNNEILWTWSYPSIEPEEREIFTRNVIFNHPSSSRQKSFRILRYRNHWTYVYFSEVFSSDKLTKVKQVAFLLSSLDFNPEKYETLCRILTKSYCKSGNPTVTLDLFLSVLITGKCITEENGTFFADEFETNTPFRNHIIKDIIGIFGLDTIILFTALLLNMRLAVYHHDIDALSEFIFSLPSFVIHKNIWNSIYPYVDCQEDEILQFKDSKFHIIGSTNSRLENFKDIYDVFINVPASEINIHSQAKETMNMTKLHKDMALFMIKVSENKNLTERDAIFEIARKAKEFQEKLKLSEC